MYPNRNTICQLCICSAELSSIQDCTVVNLPVVLQIWIIRT